MTEAEATADLSARGVWRLAPGLWGNRAVPEMIAVAPQKDNARDVRAALKAAGDLPPKRK